MHENKDTLDLIKDYIRDVEMYGFEPKFHNKLILDNIEISQYLPHLISI